ncbi:MAG: ribonuclease J, partial [bacterium]
MKKQFLLVWSMSTDVQPDQAILPPIPSVARKTLRLIPLGGLGEFGLNMLLFEYEDDIILIDCGSMFPEAEMLGVDYVIPEINYVFDKLEKVRGILLTHGHDDHIGALPYVFRQILAPLYGTRLTLAIARAKLEEFELDKVVEFHEVTHRAPFNLGAFGIEYIRVTHSFPDASSIAIRTPVGVVVISGDYKIDYTPVDGKPFDFQRFAQLSEEGVLALLADSTNVEREGNSRSEAEVVKGLDPFFASTQRSLIFSSFASSLHRIQTVIDLARAHKKKAFVTGRSLERNVGIASSLGYLKIPANTLMDMRDLESVPPQKRVILTSGSQGEPMSALSRMSLDDHKQIQVMAGDTVIISARIIPGNEKAIFRMINHFFRRGARVIYEDIAPVHCSGHAYRNEMRQLISLVKPKYLIPIHGELRHLIAHAELARSMGLTEDRTLVIENGDVLEFNKKGATRGGKVLAGHVLVDGKGIGDVKEVVLRDRMHLSQDGMLIAILAIDRATLQIVAGPDIVTRGFVYVEENEVFLKRCEQVVLDAFNECEKESKEEWAVVKDAVRRALKRFIRKEFERFPVILP